jgi:hypothetical protein
MSPPHRQSVTQISGAGHSREHPLQLEEAPRANGTTGAMKGLGRDISPQPLRLVFLRSGLKAPRLLPEAVLATARMNC